CARARAEPAGKVDGQRVIATGVKENDIRAALARHVAQHKIEIDGAEVEVRLRCDLRVDRCKIIAAFDLQAVAGKVKKPGLGARKLFAETQHVLAHAGVIKIKAKYDIETEALERGRDVARVVDGVVELRGEFIGGIADHERHPAAG